MPRCARPDVQIGSTREIPINFNSAFASTADSMGSADYFREHIQRVKKLTSKKKINIYIRKRQNTNETHKRKNTDVTKLPSSSGANPIISRKAKRIMTFNVFRTKEKLSPVNNGIKYINNIKKKIIKQKCPSNIHKAQSSSSSPMNFCFLLIIKNSKQNDFGETRNPFNRNLISYSHKRK